MEINPIVENGFSIMNNHFKNMRILTFEELTYILLQSSPLTETSLRSLSTWYHDLVNFQYLRGLCVNTCDIFVEEKAYMENIYGEQDHLKHSLSPHHLQLHFEILCHMNKIEWNYSKPYNSFLTVLENIQYRVTLIHNAITTTGLSKAFIRKVTTMRFDLNSFAPFEITEIALNSLAHYHNILICGATGSGKTAFTSALLGHIPARDHTLILEDTKELIAPANSTQLLACESPNKSLVDFCFYAMRLSPKRIIIGEMRAKEVIPFLLMMNTGHKGLMSTIHASSAIEAIHRCAFLFSIYNDNQSLGYDEILKLVSMNIDYVFYLENKKVIEVIKVLGSEKKNCFFEQVYSSHVQFQN